MSLRAGGMALDIWMKLDLKDCATRNCPYLHDSSFEIGDICVADNEQKCPEVRRQLWKLRSEIPKYYSVTCK